MAYLKKKTVFAYWDTLPTEYNKHERVEAAMDNFGKKRGRDKERFYRMHFKYAPGTSTSADPELPLTGGTMEDPAQRRVVADEGKERRYIFTCAQNNTDLIPDAWWDNLLRVAEHYDAELHISQFTYNKSAYGKNSVKPGSKKATDGEDLHYDERISEYVSNEDIQITPDLVWLGSVNVLPTAVNPLTGWDTHTRQASFILPHAKLAMQSYPTMKHDPARFGYTTGAVTQRNYIQKASGQKADFHHVFGAVLVEVDKNNDWWVRQLNFDSQGRLFDLDVCFDPSQPEVLTYVRTAAITHGDIHGYKRDHEVLKTVFGQAGLLDTLLPRHQFFHDVIDFMPRNHHNRRQFNFLSEMHQKGYDKVHAEFTDIAYWLMHDAYRDWCTSHVVVSNHDQAINNWLDDRSALDDPPNVKLWLEMNLSRVSWPGKTYHPFKALLLSSCARTTAGGMWHTRTKPNVILEDESFKLHGIEMGMHGHLGPNGARGQPRNLKVVGKANTGHTHSAGIVEGVYTAGVLGNLDMGYNKGPSSWSHSSIVTYANGKRTIITYRAGKWCL